MTGAIAVVAKYVQNPIFGDKHIDWVTIINEVTGLETEIPIQKVVEILMIGSAHKSINRTIFYLGLN